MTEHKTDINIIKIEKYKNWTWRCTKHVKKTEQHFCEEAQNRHEHYWKTEHHLYRGIQNSHEHDWKTEQHFYNGTQTRHEKYKKLNDTSMTEHISDMNNTKIDKYKTKNKKTEHDRTQNRHEH